MKNNLLFGAALLLTISAAAQQPKRLAASMADVARDKYIMSQKQDPEVSIQNPVSAPIIKTMPNGKTSKAAALTINWGAVTKSMNVLGCLVTEQRPVQWNEDLDAVSLIVRRGPFYTMNPAPTTTGAISGGIIAYITTNQGFSWDSTLVWNNSTNWARYPQGGIYCPSGTPTTMANSYAVVTGPTTSNSNGWVGSYFASKQLNVFDNTASSASGAQQWFSSNSTLAPYDANVKKIDMARLNFQIPDDNAIRVLGEIVNDYNYTTNNTDVGYRGARIVKGSFNAGVFNWTSDSIGIGQCPVDYDANSLAYNVLDFYTSMAWNESGTTGYLWFIGIRNIGVTGNNIGLQPIIWKTTNSGTSWSLMPPINFNDSVTFKPMLQHMTRVETGADKSLRIPYFNNAEDIGAAVDKNGNLHLVATVWSTRHSHADSLGFLWTYTNSVQDGQTYRYEHTPGKENYIYDFSTINAGSSWSVTLVDSMETEFCGGTGLGNAVNPYTSTKYSVGARIQASRSPGGDYIIYNWADSKYLFTTNALHWNTRPDLYARARHVDSVRVSPTPKYDLTGFPAANEVYTSAYMHYASPKSKVVSATVPAGVGTPGVHTFTVDLSLKVCSSNPLDGDLPNTHYYGSGNMTFTYAIAALPSPTIDAVSENTALAAGSVLYPNPANESSILGLNLAHNASVDVTILNIVGQRVKTLSVQATAGENQFDINVANLPKGVYMVNIKVDNASATKKLIVE